MQFDMIVKTIKNYFLLFWVIVLVFAVSQNFSPPPPQHPCTIFEILCSFEFRCSSFRTFPCLSPKCVIHTSLIWPHNEKSVKSLKPDGINSLPKHLHELAINWNQNNFNFLLTRPLRHNITEQHYRHGFKEFANALKELSYPALLYMATMLSSPAESKNC